MADVEFAYMDDFSLEGEANTVAADVENIMKDYVNTGLQLNPTKCEITAKKFDCIQGIQTFSAFKEGRNCRLDHAGCTSNEGQSSRISLP